MTRGVVRVLGGRTHVREIALLEVLGNSPGHMVSGVWWWVVMGGSMTLTALVGSWRLAPVRVSPLFRRESTDGGCAHVVHSSGSALPLDFK